MNDLFLKNLSLTLSNRQMFGRYEWLRSGKSVRFQCPSNFMVREETSAEDFRAITQNLQEVGFKTSFISGLMMPVLNAISDLALSHQWLWLAVCRLLLVS